ncbi:hypothetical protein EDB81DRAFT_778849 [Dactylonectria macrodidyma]|uniref:Secreted protein n=1 Tax=Dactylonectria macrodidyma TaxID=307937 RepID=A0A9P9JM44_9HYPO|nr:hypothetical protein EDB81DRAFT_778849 [Dactylonectria macrodidyma]
MLHGCLRGRLVMILLILSDSILQFKSSPKTSCHLHSPSPQNACFNTPPSADPASASVLGAWMPVLALHHLVGLLKLLPMRASGQIRRHNFVTVTLRVLAPPPNEARVSCHHPALSLP